MAGGLILRGASCCGTDFHKAGIEGADFTGACLSGDTRFAGARGVEGVRVDHVRYEGEEIRGDAVTELLVRLAHQ